MTLIVAKMHNEDRGLSLVGDTKITDELGDETWNRQVFRHAIPKIRILRDDLAVGMAGGNPQLAIPRLNALRNLPTEAVLSALADESHASFVVAALGVSRRLWTVRNGEVQDRQHVGRAWVGDPEANEVFTQRTAELATASRDQSTKFLLIGAMQSLLAFGEVETVGGYATRVSATDDGFRFGCDSSGVGPDLVHGVVDSTRDGSTLGLLTPPDVASTGYDLQVLAGVPPTIGALACLIPEAATAWLFRDHDPWVAQTVTLTSLTELVRWAAEEHGQYLVGPPVRGGNG